MINGKIVSVNAYIRKHIIGKIVIVRAYFPLKQH